MISFKSSLAYIFGLVSLIISIVIVGQGKSVKVEVLPSPTPTATPFPRPEPFPGAARWVRCQDLFKPRFFFYTPATPASPGQHLTLSGMVYASNLTPLPNALIEIAQGNPNSPSSPPSSSLIRTDESGHYEFTTLLPARLEQFYLHYLVTYQDYCPLLISLHVVVEPPSRPVKRTHAQIEVVGPVLHGPVDIVLPVPAPRP